MDIDLSHEAVLFAQRRLAERPGDFDYAVERTARYLHHCLGAPVAEAQVTAYRVVNEAENGALARYVCCSSSTADAITLVNPATGVRESVSVAVINHALQCLQARRRVLASRG